MKKITAIVWHSTAVRLKTAGKELKGIVDAKIYSGRNLDEEKESFDELCRDIYSSDILLLNVTSGDSIWDDIFAYIDDKDIKKIYIGANATEFIKDSETLENSAKCNDYYTFSGTVNLINLLKYAACLAGDKEIDYEEPVQTPWEGIFHPDDPDKEYESPDDYFKEYPKSDKGVIAILVARGSKINNDLEPEKEIIKQIEEKGYSTLPVYTYSWPEPSLGAKGAAWAIKKYMFDESGKAIPDALIKMTGFFINGRNDSDSKELLKELNCPVFKPVCSYNTTIEEWEESKDGTIKDVGWSIALP